MTDSHIVINAYGLMDIIRFIRTHRDLCVYLQKGIGGCTRFPLCFVICSNYENPHRQRPRHRHPGKRSPDGLFLEYAYNREIAIRVTSELTDCGFDAELLVPEIFDVPLSERCRRANAVSDASAAKM